MRLYADHNATSSLRPEAREALLRALDVGGNASSVHGEGRAARRVLEDARELLARTLEVRADDVTFTSGATEALHLAMETASSMSFSPVLVSAVEHDAVWAAAGVLWPQFETIPVNAGALIDASWLQTRLRQLEPGQKPLVIAQGANNETGTIQMLDKIATMTRAAGGAMICDGVQMAGKVKSSSFTGMADWLVLSSHKIGGPPGAGALITLPGTPVINQRPGGGQERGARAGTENVPAIAGFAAAAAVACGNEAIDAYLSLTASERNAFELALVRQVRVDLIGQSVRRLTNTSCVGMAGWEAARQVMALDLAGASISAGSACSSGKVKTSRVLAASGWAPAIAGSTIRASFGWSTVPGDGQRLAELYLTAASRAGVTLHEKV
jgi:cysteine desulfurase